MAGSAESGANSENLPEVRPDPQDMKTTAARLYAMGYKRPEIARAMVDHLVRNKDKPLEQRLSQARKRLRDWERHPKFRDLIWKQGLIKLDMESPGILTGISRKARQGRVDAARLVFELTGRHNPKGEDRPTQIAVVIGGVPRPQMMEHQAVEAEADDADDDED